MLSLPYADTSLLADASAGDYATGGLVGMLVLGLPALGAWIRSVLKDRQEERRQREQAQAELKEKAAKLTLEQETARAALQRTSASDAALAWEKYNEAVVKQLREEIQRCNEESSGRARRLNDELKLRDDRISKLEESNQRCEKEHKETAILAAGQAAEIKLLHAELRRLFAHVGGGAPGVTQPTFVTANEDGKIVDVTAQCGPMFHWNREELIGQSIEVLIPPELHAPHRAAFSAVARGEVQVDPEKVTASQAIRRNGERFPVVIVHTSWQNKETGKRFIGAEIKDDLYGASPVAGVELAGPSGAEKKEDC